MNKLSLLGSVALAASLIAGTAMAQNANNNMAGANNNEQSGGHASLYSEGGHGQNGQQAMRRPVINPQGYANVGFGGYSGQQEYIRNGNNGNGGNGNNGGGWGSGGWAQNGNNWGRNGNNNGNNNWRPSQRNGALADNGDVRASKAIGTGVYNTRNQQVGTVNDILLGHNGVFAVIKTNNKKIAIPFRDLRFGNASNNGNDEIVLPNSTQARLNTLPVFHYNVTNYQAYQNAGNNNGNGGGNYANNNGRNGNGWFGGGAFNNGNPRNGSNQHGGGNNGNNNG